MTKEKNRTAKNGEIITIEFTLRLDDGEVISNSADEGPLTFPLDDDMPLIGLKNTLLGLAEGEEFNVVIEPDEGYGDYDEDNFEIVPLSAFGEEEVVQGEDYTFQDENGEDVVATVTEITDEGAVLDYNHPLAGETLHFKGKVLKIESGEA